MQACRTSGWLFDESLLRRSLDERHSADARMVQNQHTELLKIKQQLASNTQDQLRSLDEARQTDLVRLWHE